MQNAPKEFAAVFVLNLSVSNDPRIVTRFETYLFTATSTDDAFQQASAFAPRLNDSYRNSDGNVVTITCLGIHDLNFPEPGSDDLPGLVSSADFVAPSGTEFVALITEREHLACYDRRIRRSGFPNLSQ